MCSATENISILSDEELRCELIKNGINAGPIGPSTRKVYESKLLKLFNNLQQTEIVVNTIRGSTPIATNGVNGSRHTSPAPQLNCTINSTLNGHGLIHENKLNENRLEEEQNSDEDEHEESDDFEESFRHLSPEEVIRFRSKFSAFRNSDVPPVVKKASKVSNVKTAFVALALFGIIGFSLIIITKINFMQNYNLGEKDEI